MSKITTSDEDEIEEYVFPEYTNQELWSLNNLLKEKYNNGNTREDITKWLQDEGALGKNESVITTGNTFKRNKVGEYYPVCDYPTKYELLQDKLNKANKLLGRKEFAQRKQIENLTKDILIESDVDKENIEDSLKSNSISK